MGSTGGHTFKIYANRAGLKHDTGPGHPERPERLQALLDLLTTDFPHQPLEDAPAADDDDLARVHDQDYLLNLKNSIPANGLAHLDSDTVVCPESWEAIRQAAGAVCQAVDDIIEGNCDSAFCAVRPPGHHAFPDHAEGFCLLNNICIGALRAVEVHGLKRVAIVDFDVHHGNGSDFIARMHPELFYASTHQWPLYPGTGLPEDDINGRVLNRMMQAGQGSEVFRKLWAGLFASLETSRPDLIMISAGFDAHRDDPLAQINLLDEDFEWITDQLVKKAASLCDGKIVSVLEGGYNLDVLKSAGACHIQALSG